MPRKKAPQIEAWSFSRKRDYDICPLKAKLAHVDRIREPENDAMKRGKKVHEDAEKFSTCRIKNRPPSLDLFDEEFDHLRRINKRLETESRYGITKDWKPTGFFDSDVWLRVVFDLAYAEDNGDTIEIIDYKTGRQRPENVCQLDLYAASAAAIWPDAKRFNCSFWYLDQGVEERLSYDAKIAKALQKKWTKAVLKMLNDRTFAPTPSNKCRWCFYRSTEGGQCKY